MGFLTPFGQAVFSGYGQGKIGQGLVQVGCGDIFQRVSRKR